MAEEGGLELGHLLQGLGLMHNGVYDGYNDGDAVSVSDGGESLKSGVSVLSKISAVSSGLGRFITMPIRKLSDVVRGNRDGAESKAERKAGSRVGSRMGSRKGSRHASRKTSRQGSRAGSPPRSSPSSDSTQAKVAWVRPGASRASLDMRGREQQGMEAISETPASPSVAGTLSRGVSGDYGELRTPTGRGERRGGERELPSTTAPERQTVSVDQCGPLEPLAREVRVCTRDQNVLIEGSIGEALMNADGKPAAGLACGSFGMSRGSV